MKARSFSQREEESVDRVIREAAQELSLGEHERDEVRSIGWEVLCVSRQLFLGENRGVAAGLCADQGGACCL